MALDALSVMKKLAQERKERRDAEIKAQAEEREKTEEKREDTEKPEERRAVKNEKKPIPQAYRVYKTWDERKWMIMLSVLEVEGKIEDYGMLGEIVATDIPNRELARDICKGLNSGRLKLNKDFWK